MSFKKDDIVEFMDEDHNVRIGRVTRDYDPDYAVVNIEWTEVSGFLIPDVKLRERASAVDQLASVAPDCSECHDEPETFNYCPHCGAAK